MQEIISEDKVVQEGDLQKQLSQCQEDLRILRNVLADRDKIWMVNFSKHAEINTQRTMEHRAWFEKQLAQYESRHELKIKQLEEAYNQIIILKSELREKNEENAFLKDLLVRKANITVDEDNLSRSRSPMSSPMGKNWANQSQGVLIQIIFLLIQKLPYLILML